jgi:hypothetical protein
MLFSPLAIAGAGGTALMHINSGPCFSPILDNTEQVRTLTRDANPSLWMSSRRVT